MMRALQRWRRSLADGGPLAIFPLAGALLLPGGQLPLNIFEPRYLRMIDDALAGARMIGMVQPRAEGVGPRPAIYDVGCAGRITSFSETDDGRYLINLTGVRRFRVLEELTADTPNRQVRPDYAAFPADASTDASASLVDRSRLERAMRTYLDAEGLQADWEAVEDAPLDALVASLAMSCPFAPNEKQALLEAPTVSDRADCLVALMEMAIGDDSDDETPLQ